MNDNDIPITYGSGNVFADLGLPQPELLQQKADIVIQIHAMMSKKGFVDLIEPSRLLQISPYALNRLIRGHTREYSIDRLANMLQILKNQRYPTPED